MTAEEIASLRRSNVLVRSAVHPDTQEVLPFWLRQSTFICFNMPLVFAAVFKKKQTKLFSLALILAQNTNVACMNYGNRNATCSITN